MQIIGNFIAGRIWLVRLSASSNTNFYHYYTLNKIINVYTYYIVFNFTNVQNTDYTVFAKQAHSRNSSSFHFSIMHPSIAREVLQKEQVTHVKYDVGVAVIELAVEILRPVTYLELLQQHQLLTRMRTYSYRISLQYFKVISILCGDANPRLLERQTCSGWHHTMGQPLYEGSRKYHFSFSFHYVSGGKFFTGKNILWHPPHSRIFLILRGALVHKSWTLLLHPFHRY